MPLTNPETVLAQDLRVGDIVTEVIGRVTYRKIVVNVTKTSAVTKSENGQDGRFAFTRKVRKQPVNTEVKRIGHRDLSKEELATLRNYYKLGEHNRSLFQHGLYQDLPRMLELFGYAEGEESQLSGDAGEVLTTVRASGEPDGDRVEIVRHMRKDYGTPGSPEKASYGARVIDGAHGIVVGYVRANLKSEDDAAEAADFYLGKRYFDGWDVEDALQQARYLADILA
jgi:hypothetical protein